jgi:hypothetical protein
MAGSIQLRLCPCRKPGDDSRIQGASGGHACASGESPSDATNPIALPANAPGMHLSRYLPYPPIAPPITGVATPPGMSRDGMRYTLGYAGVSINALGIFCDANEKLEMR